MKKILFISPVEPSSGGTGLAMRAHAVLGALRSFSQVFLLVLDPWRGDKTSKQMGMVGVARIEIPDQLFENQLSGHMGVKITPREWPTVTRQQQAFFYDLGRDLCIDKVHVFRFYMAPYAEIFFGQIPCELDLDELESHTRLRHAKSCKNSSEYALERIYKMEASFYVAVEKSLLIKFNEIYVCSDVAKEYLISLVDKAKIKVLPNVVHIPAPLAPLKSAKVFTIIFVGNMGYFPNIDAVKYICDEIVPALRKIMKVLFVVKIFGLGELPEHVKELLPREVLWLGFAETLEPEYQGCEIVLVPIRSGGGTRIKILEAFAHSRPLVSTTIGAEGLQVQHGQHYMEANSAVEIANACLQLQESGHLRKYLSENAYALVKKEYALSSLKEILC